MQGRKDDRFSRFDAMSTEELQAFLREDASKPMGEESDTKEIFYVMEVLAKRRKEQNGGKPPVEALESFKQNYHTENETPCISESVPVARKRSSRGRWKRGLVAAVAAIFILVIGNSITASALNFDLFAIIAKWTQETFHFGYASNTNETNVPSKDSSEVYSGLQAALDEYDISVALVTSYFPEGYVETDVKTQDTPKQRIFQANYVCGESSIRIKIADYLDSHPIQFEQNDALIEVYSSGGINYHIFDNHGQLQAVWNIENFECYISGPITLSEIKEMIDSIEKG